MPAIIKFMSQEQDTNEEYLHIQYTENVESELRTVIATLKQVALEQVLLLREDSMWICCIIK